MITLINRRLDGRLRQGGGKAGQGRAGRGTAERERERLAGHGREGERWWWW